MPVIGSQLAKQKKEQEGPLEGEAYLPFRLLSSVSGGRTTSRPSTGKGVDRYSLALRDAVNPILGGSGKNVRVFHAPENK